VLGTTGRNFAAGMSGGVAWVLDLRPDRLNTEYVDAVDLTADDVERVMELLARHATETGSKRAEELLSLGPDGVARRFTKILPRDYARIIRVREQAVELGLHDEELTQVLMEASRA